MEDRQPAGLWLELVRSDAAAVAARADELSGAGLRVSTWEPCTRDRADLPRRLPECAALLAGEWYGGPEVPDVPAAAPESTVLPMRRYPRPSQGICTGEPTTGLLLVLISPRQEGQAQALRDWGDFVHLRHIAACAVPGYTTITPYEHLGGAGSSPRYCHFYEMTSDDPEATYRSMTPLVAARLGGGQGTPAYDDWAWTPALRIDYVNTFRRVG